MAAACGAVLAGCDSIKDVRSEPATELPAETAVLRGSVVGLGSRRPVILEDAGAMRCEDPDDPVLPDDYFGPVFCSASFLGTFNEEVSQFTFGSIAAGEPYDVRVKTQPYGRICTVANGTGIMTASGPAAPITVNCAIDASVPRYTVTANISPAASAIEGLIVSLTTEEGVRSFPATGLTSVEFTDGIFDSGTSVPVMSWRVGATTPEGGRISKCVVTGGTAGNGSNDAGDNTQRPTANVTVNVGACVFTIGGTVTYSPPVGGTTPAMGSGGVTLQLRNILGEPVAPDVTVASFTGPGNTFTLTTTARSNAQEGIHDVVVVGHPAGQFCVVGNGGAANLYVAPNVNPANITNIAVRCRNRPAADRQLRGTYRLWSTTTTVVANNSDEPPVPETTVTVADPVISDTAGQVGLQFRNSAMMTFFEDGTFLYGSHAGGANSATANQVEHGFYDYDPSLQRILFTIHTDTSTGSALTAGLNAMPGRVTVGAGPSAVHHPALGNVQILPGDPNRITGSFGPYGTAPPPALGTQQVDWDLREPPSIAGLMTGTWASEDHRRVWVYDAATTYGFHVGVNGGAANLQDGCYPLDDVTASSGYYTRRGSLTGCYPLAATVGGGTVDIPVGSALAVLPGFIGRIPGGQTAFDGRSPSPIYFHIAPAASFFASAPAQYFPVIPTDWCATDMLGLRASLHGEAIDVPVYFCRTRVD